ncbi:unnamed protein product [Closterium sp. NIES-64]|nr:unnamed protein product [Closterium sp. NIES-64]
MLACRFPLLPLAYPLLVTCLLTSTLCSLNLIPSSPLFLPASPHQRIYWAAAAGSREEQWEQRGERERRALSPSRTGLWQRVAGREGGGMTHGRQSQRQSSGAEDKGEETEEEKRKQGRKRGSRGGEEEAEEERKQRRRRGSRGGGEEAEEEKRLLLQTCCRSVSSFGDGGGPTSGAAEPSSRGIDGSGGMDGSNGMRRTSGTAKSDKADHPLFMVRLPSQPPSPLPRGQPKQFHVEAKTGG